MDNKECILEKIASDLEVSYCEEVPLQSYQLESGNSPQNFLGYPVAHVASIPKHSVTCVVNLETLPMDNEEAIYYIKPKNMDNRLSRVDHTYTILPHSLPTAITSGNMRNAEMASQVMHRNPNPSQFVLQNTSGFQNFMVQKEQPYTLSPRGQVPYEIREGYGNSIEKQLRDVPVIKINDYAGQNMVGNPIKVRRHLNTMDLKDIGTYSGAGIKLREMARGAVEDDLTGRPHQASEQHQSQRKNNVALLEAKNMKVVKVAKETLPRPETGSQTKRTSVKECAEYDRKQCNPIVGKKKVDITTKKITPLPNGKIQSATSESSPRPNSKATHTQTQNTSSCNTLAKDLTESSKMVWPGLSLHRSTLVKKTHKRKQKNTMVTKHRPSSKKSNQRLLISGLPPSAAGYDGESEQEEESNKSGCEPPSGNEECLNSECDFDLPVLRTTERPMSSTAEAVTNHISGLFSRIPVVNVCSTDNYVTNVLENSNLRYVTGNESSGHSNLSKMMSFPSHNTYSTAEISQKYPAPANSNPLMKLADAASLMPNVGQASTTPKIMRENLTTQSRMPPAKNVDHIFSAPNSVNTNPASQIVRENVTAESVMPPLSSMSHTSSIGNVIYTNHITKTYQENYAAPTFQPSTENTDGASPHWQNLALTPFSNSADETANQLPHKSHVPAAHQMVFSNPTQLSKALHFSSDGTTGIDAGIQEQTPFGYLGQGMGNSELHSLENFYSSPSGSNDVVMENTSAGIHLLTARITNCWQALGEQLKTLNAGEKARAEPSSSFEDNAKQYDVLHSLHALCSPSEDANAKDQNLESEAAHCARTLGFHGREERHNNERMEVPVTSQESNIVQIEHSIKVTEAEKNVAGLSVVGNILGPSSNISLDNREDFSKKKRKKLHVIKQGACEFEQESNGVVMHTEVIVAKKRSKHSHATKKSESGVESSAHISAISETVKEKIKRKCSRESEDQDGDKGEFRCGFCRKIFHFKNRFKAHLRTHDAHVFSDIFSCPTCGRSFTTNSGLGKHVSIHRRSVDTKNNRTDDAKTKRPDDAKTRRPNDKIKHSHSVKHNSQYSCKLCNKVFVYEVPYNKHMRRHASDRSTFDCEKCQKTFSETDVLHKHMRTQHPDKRYICNICNRLFFIKMNLVEHKKIHDKLDAVRPDSENKPVYNCNLCEKSFSKRNSYTNHVRLKHRTMAHSKALKSPLCKSKAVNDLKLKERHTSGSGSPESDGNSQTSVEELLDVETDIESIIPTQKEVISDRDSSSADMQDSRISPESPTSLANALAKYHQQNIMESTSENEPTPHPNATDSPSIKNKDCDNVGSNVFQKSLMNPPHVSEVCRTENKKLDCRHPQLNKSDKLALFKFSTVSIHNGSQPRDTSCKSTSIVLKPPCVEKRFTAIKKELPLASPPKTSSKCEIKPLPKPSQSQLGEKRGTKTKTKKSKKEYRSTNASQNLHVAVCTPVSLQPLATEVAEEPDQHVELCNGQYVISNGVEKDENVVTAHIAHTADDSNETTFLCEICSDILPSINSFEDHLKSHIEKNQDVSEAQDAMNRLREKYGAILDCSVKISTMDIFECEQCKKTFSDSGTFKNHVKRHKTEQKNSDKSTGQKIDLKDSDSMAVRAATEEQRKPMKSDNPFDDYFKLHPCDNGIFSCKQCRYMFADKLDLNKHMDIMHGKAQTGKRGRRTICRGRPKYASGPLCCNICYKSFETTESHTKHKKLHKTASFACVICGKVCMILSNIRKHVSGHFSPDNIVRTASVESEGRRANTRKLSDCDDVPKKKKKRHSSMI